ncbi:NADH:ubiquinone reductase (non-electrogenic) [Microdochium nivale]|nr:NADH:ubiquinone reductase (non-electrogenic) [Microdochium nivale]
MNAKPTIAIVGSGWAGFTLAHALSLTKYNVVVISPIRTVQYTPLLASAAAGMFDFRLAEEPVLRRNLIPGLRYLKAKAEKVDFAARTLHCRPAVSDIAGQRLADSHPFTIRYDRLVLTPGCSVQTFGTPGAAEHAHFLRTTDDARRIQQRLLEMLDAASVPGLTRAQQRDMLRVVLVGGGAIGIEATAELYDLWLHDMRFLYPHLDVSSGDGEGDSGISKALFSVEIHDVAPTILGTFDDRLAGYALDKLQSRGIAIETSSHIEKVERGAIWTKERGRIGYGLLIWATGNGVNPLVESLDAVKKDGKPQRIVTDQRLRVRRATGGADEVMPEVYALGDCADIEGYALPTLAEVAVQKAEYLARQLNAEDLAASDNDGSSSSSGSLSPGCKPFEYRQKPNLAYLGQHDGVIGGQDEWTGHSAWLAWRGGSIYHWPRSWRRTLMIGISWVFNAVGGRDIARRW